MEWRRLVSVFGPRWLARDQIRLADGELYDLDARVPYALLTLLDIIRLRLRYGVRARMPGLAPIDALQYIGRGLGIFQGPDESTDAYRVRLISGIDDKRLAGTPWPMLRQLRGFLTPHAVRVRIVNEHGHFYTIDRDGTESRVRYTAWNWDNGRANALAKGYVRKRANGVVGPAIPWSRFWVIIYPTTDATPQPWQRKKWGDGHTYADGTTWGSTATAEEVFGIRRIVRNFKPLGSRCVSIMISYDDTAYNPAALTAPIDGTWARAGKLVNGTLVNGRDANTLFWDGTLPGSVL